MYYPEWFCLSVPTFIQVNHPRIGSTGGECEVVQYKPWYEIIRLQLYYYVTKLIIMVIK